MAEKLLIAGEIALFSTIPQGFACLYFALMFWGYRVDHYLKRIAVYSLCTAGVFFAMMLLPLSFRPFGILTYIGLILFLFRDLKLRDRFITSFTVLLLYIIPEIVMAYIVISLGLIDGEMLAKDPRNSLPYLILVNIFIGILAMHMDNKRISPGSSLRMFLAMNNSRVLMLLILLFVLNIFASSQLFFYASSNQMFAATIALVALTIINAVILVFTVRAIALIKNQAIVSTQDTYVEEIERLLTTIRGQRHDFLNHVQVIQAFVQQKKTNELAHYVAELVGEIVEINKLLQIGNPALAALIQAKMVYALDRKIELRCSFEGMQQMNHGIASVDYVKIAGNLLDNAIEAVMNRPAEERWVEISGKTDHETFYLVVSNPIDSLNEDLKNNLFRPGFTTKKDGKHSGLGLSIVKDLVSRYQGTIELDTANNHVLSFRVTLPIRSKEMPA